MGNDVTNLVALGDATFFVLLNWLLTLSMATWLLMVLSKARYLIVKPSIMLLGFTHIFFQWPLCIYAAYLELYLPDPYDVSIMIHGYMFIGFLFMSFTFRKEARVVWCHVTNKQFRGDSNLRGMYILFGFCALITFFYLKIVPINQTGMYALFIDPELATTAREDSLKLIDSQFLKYAYSFMASGLSLLLVSMLALLIRDDFMLKQKKIHRALFSIMVILVLMVVVSLTGARGYAVNLVLVMAATFFLRAGAKFPIGKSLMVACVVLFPAAVLTIAREGAEAHWDTLIGSLLLRSFVIPFDVGTWYAHYAQHNGFIGVLGIPKLAALLEEPVIDVPNIIGLAYAAFPIPTISANAGYLLSQYSYWGLYALPISLAALFFLEIILLVFVKLDGRIVLPAVASIAPIMLAFISVDYTVVWITHGLLVVLFSAWILGLISRFKLSLFNLDPR